MSANGVCDWIPGLPSFLLPLSVSANPTPSFWAPLKLKCVGGMPEQEGAASTLTPGNRGCLLGGQRRKHSSACLFGRPHLHEHQRNRENITCDKRAMLDNKPPFFFSVGALDYRDPGGPNRCETHMQVSSGGLCSSQQLAFPHTAGTGNPQCLSMHPPGMMVIYSPGHLTRNNRKRLLPSHCHTARIWGLSQSVGCPPWTPGWAPPGGEPRKSHWVPQCQDLPGGGGLQGSGGARMKSQSKGRAGG